MYILSIYSAAASRMPRGSGKPQIPVVTMNATAEDNSICTYRDFCGGQPQ